MTSESPLASLLRPSIRQLPVYEPGRPIELVARDFGLQPDSVDKLASNENPLGPSPKALAALQQAAPAIWLYPDNSAFFLKQALAQRWQLPVEHWIVTAGSNEIFYLLGHAFIQPGTQVVLGQSAFITYKIVTLLHGGIPVEVPLLPDLRHDLSGMLAAITPHTRLVFLPNPNNPTGTAVDPHELLDFVEKLPSHVVFVYDEAYFEYQEQPPDLRPLVRAGKQIIGCRTFSKIYGLAGLRIGYGYASPELIHVLEKIRPPFNVNSLALAAALAALDDEAHVRASRMVNREGLRQLSEGLQQLGLRIIPSQANFLLFEIGPRANHILQALLRQGIILRGVTGYGLPHHLRVSVGTAEQNQRFLEALAGILKQS